MLETPFTVIDGTVRADASAETVVFITQNLDYYFHSFKKAARDSGDRTFTLASIDDDWSFACVVEEFTAAKVIKAKGSITRTLPRSSVDEQLNALSL